MTSYNVTTKPLRLAVNVLYNTEGELQAVNIMPEFSDAVIVYARGDGGSTPGDLFDEAFEKVCARALTLVRTPVPEAPEAKP